jgi:hypothetical protein
MPVRDPGSTSNKPPQIADAIPSAGAMAARRSDPGVCAVPRSNWTGLTMLIVAEELMAAPDRQDFQPENKPRLAREPLNWGLVLSVEEHATSFPTIMMTAHIEAGDASCETRYPAAKSPVGPSAARCILIRQAPDVRREPLASHVRTAGSANGRDRCRRLASYTA